MTQVKLNRESFRHKRDNLTDGCGYLGCDEMVWDEIERRAKVRRSHHKTQVAAIENVTLEAHDGTP
jgi:hypothetical protein